MRLLGPGKRRREHLEARDTAVPGGKALRVLRCDAGGGAVGAAEHDGAVDGAAAHVQRLRCAVDDLVDGCAAAEAPAPSEEARTMLSGVRLCLPSASEAGRSPPLPLHTFESRNRRGATRQPAEETMTGCGRSWCAPCIAKLKVMNSQIGLRPLKAAPTAMPVNPACANQHHPR